MTSAPLSRGLPFPHYRNGYYAYRSCRAATRLNLLVNVCVTLCGSSMEGVREMQSSNMLSKHLPPQIALSKVFMASAQMIPPKMVYKSSSPPRQRTESMQYPLRKLCFPPCPRNGPCRCCLSLRVLLVPHHVYPLYSLLQKAVIIRHFFWCVILYMGMFHLTQGLGFKIWQENQERSLTSFLKIKKKMETNKQTTGPGLNMFWWDLVNCWIAKDNIRDYFY